MPPSHLITGPGAFRFCSALSSVPMQFTVFINSVLGSVIGVLDTHCIQGALIPIYGLKNIFFENKLVICGPGDCAAPDFICTIPLHITKLPWPLTGSFNTFYYAGGGSGFLGALSKIG
mgnify:CR=1 FL=1